MLFSTLAQADIIKRSPDKGSHFNVISKDSVTGALLCSEYVPAYSHIYLYESSQVPLAVNLSIRNIDPENNIVVSRVDYFDTKGEKQDSLLEGVFSLAPMSTVSFVIDQQEMSGGAGANFIVDWLKMDDDVSAPLVEAVMAGYRGTKGLSFTSRSVRIGTCRKQ
nr:DUF3124 domain-containing protein [Oceanospirillum sediminis]